MLGKTAGGLFWMFRYLERSENTARLLDAGFRITLTRPATAASEWKSVLTTAGSIDDYEERHDNFDSARIIDFLLRDASNPASVLNTVKAARDNARLVRTALTREVWEAINEAWMTLKSLLSRPVRDRDVPEVLSTIRQQNALVRGATAGTMLRNDGYNFIRIGTFLERADNTARILDVKYYLLLPSIAQIGSSLDNMQWEIILRSVSAQRAYQWLNGADTNSKNIANFLILHRQMPRSLAFCSQKIKINLGYLEQDYRIFNPSGTLAQAHYDKLTDCDIEAIFEFGLHEYIERFILENNVLASQIAQDYRFERE
ncbi:MAG: alpha-E domain-containing protein [Sphingobium sp.]